jgi:hypothetical protein
VGLKSDLGPIVPGCTDLYGSYQDNSEGYRNLGVKTTLKNQKNYSFHD